MVLMGILNVNYCACGSVQVSGNVSVFLCVLENTHLNGNATNE
jgi:hypothetical protein